MGQVSNCKDSSADHVLETMERMMDYPFVYSGQSARWAPPLPTKTGRYSRGRTLWERFDMPGMTKEDVKVWVEEKMLVVKARRSPRRKMVHESRKKKVKNGQLRIMEGKTVDLLAEKVQFEKIKAEVKDGVLYITIPKAMSSSKVLDINVQ